MANNAKREALIITYQRLKDYKELVNITIEARRAVDKA